jgi:RES domain-containing protein
VASWLIEPPRVAGEWQCFRQVSPKFPALFHAAGEPLPSQESGRWHVEGEGYAQYLALSPLGAWAELVRYYSIRSEDLAREQLRNLWLVLVRESKIADLATFDKWESCGLDPRDAVDKHMACQALGRELLTAGYRGVLSPSAALPGVANLTLFGERYERVLGGGLDTWKNPDPNVFLPCERVAEDASPPVELLAETCFLDGPHLGYRTYLSDQGLPMPSGTP